MVPEAGGAHAPLQWTIAALAFAAHLLVAARALTRANRTPASRAAWVAVVMLAPGVGMLAYLLLGETSIGRARFRRVEQVLRRMTAAAALAPPPAAVAVVDGAVPLLELARTINGLPAVGGNRVELLGEDGSPADAPERDCRRALDALVADIEQARESVHIAVYIWLDDGAGGRLADAVAAAARRGVACRVMVDALGSRAFIDGPRWQQLAQAGVRQLKTLDDIHRLQHVAFSRMDLRDHRKIVVIDNRIGYCGSQNLADPEFRIKPAQAPWIDLLLRCQGPVVAQLQFLFLSGWIPESGEAGLDGYAAAAAPAWHDDGCVAMAFETGPVARHNVMADVYVACIYAARRELVITTPYFVPDESILRAICAAPRRGVRTTLVLPRRNDSWLVGQASRSTYGDLLRSGVELHEYPLGLLHAKSMTVDGQVSLVGSANMDRRSLELNFENSLLVADPRVTAAIRQRQQRYLSVSVQVTVEQVQRWSFATRLVQNAVAMMSPVL
ncbi:phospholipase D-like domain-containing protein [Stenotrophomonas acidaminiphila]|uniref:phospholipase D-like domain-containing protein n=1 Tax=Stenotrophomonas acidaminiphila TaxID=128780 RepID=UPI0028B0F16B|nr:phospholipase D-like domain-containing protein [Stenotrophomonas acidaminiphila]